MQSRAIEDVDLILHSSHSDSFCSGHHERFLSAPKYVQPTMIPTGSYIDFIYLAFDGQGILSNLQVVIVNRLRTFEIRFLGVNVPLYISHALLRTVLHILIGQRVSMNALILGQPNYYYTVSFN